MGRDHPDEFIRAPELAESDEQPEWTIAWLTEPGEVVERGDKLAVLRAADGKTFEVAAPARGSIEQRFVADQGSAAPNATLARFVHASAPVRSRAVAALVVLIVLGTGIAGAANVGPLAGPADSVGGWVSDATSMLGNDTGGERGETQSTINDQSREGRAEAAKVLARLRAVRAARSRELLLRQLRRERRRFLDVVDDLNQFPASWRRHARDTVNGVFAVLRLLTLRNDGSKAGRRCYRAARAGLIRERRQRAYYRRCGARGRCRSKINIQISDSGCL